jgi:RHS repeat-associated protein
VYDYLGRRVLKVVEEYDGSSWSETARRKFVWSGWLMLVEIDASGETDAVMRQNTWGLDLAGQNGGGIAYAAGGIGGLLAVHDTRGTVPTGDDLDGVFTYDANGNVGQVVDLTATTWSSAAITAHYEYAPHGGVTNTISGYAYAAENPWRFSTKQWDPETALGYWGRRYYSAALGRWLNEDPIEERGGVNLYAYARNNPIDRGDVLGLLLCAGPSWNPRYHGPAPEPWEPDPDNPCYSFTWPLGTESATLCDGHGNLVICLNPNVFGPQDGPVGDTPSSFDDDAVDSCGSVVGCVKVCLIRGERTAVAALQNNPLACRDENGDPRPAGTIRADDPDDPASRARIELNNCSRARGAS